MRCLKCNYEKRNNYSVTYFLQGRHGDQGMFGLLPTGDKTELVIQHGFLVPLCYHRERKRIRLYNERTTVSAETKEF